jgi:multiple antibiotic resistance protein
MTRQELLFDLITLWVTVDPVGTLPVYLSVTKHLTKAKRRKAAFRASIIAFLILAGFLYLGQIVLDEMHIELISFQIAGGIVLFLFALSMIFEKESQQELFVHDESIAREGPDVAVFPLAMPTIATPGALLAVVVLTDNNTHSFLEETATCGLLFVVIATTLIMMLLGDRIVAFMGRSGLSVLSRVMGMILAAAAVQMVMRAIHGELGPG